MDGHYSAEFGGNATSWAPGVRENTAEGNEALHAVVKKCLRIFNGRVSSLPTASLPSVEGMGLLLFLNLKQAHLNQATRLIDLYQYPVLKPLLSIIEFINYVVGGLIVEAEKIDEMYLAIKKEMIKRETRMDNRGYQEKTKTRVSGSQLDQILGVHFPCKPTATATIKRNLQGLEAPTDEELATLNAIEDDRWIFGQLKQHLASACGARAILHGKIPGGMDANEADAIVQELGIAHTFRKAIHKVKDAVNQVEDKDSVPALHTLAQFIDYLHYGVSVALDELENCEVTLRKKNVSSAAERRILALEQRDKENKRASCSALRFNSIVNSPKKRQQVLQQQSLPQAQNGGSAWPTQPLSYDNASKAHRGGSPSANESHAPSSFHPTQPSFQPPSYQPHRGSAPSSMPPNHQHPSTAQHVRPAYREDTFLDAYCCE
ncbi:hypothetical protein DIPPA_01593 [Diplonema papillatum]|nr:hypothetical protein DIPPA_01593 [Diplonema papillatum]